MNIVADEGVDHSIVIGLRKHGHHVWYIAEMETGITDNAVLDFANSHQALLLTEDKDFGELVYREQRVSHGVVLIRLSGLSSTIKSEITVAAVSRHAHELMHAFSVVTPSAIRIRRQDQ